MARYSAKLLRCVYPEMSENDMVYYWFQQDGATAWSGHDSMTLLLHDVRRTHHIEKNGDLTAVFKEKSLRRQAAKSILASIVSLIVHHTSQVPQHAPFER